MWNWFVTKKMGASINDDHACRYRGPGGTRCAVGVLLSDEEAAKLEGKSLVHASAAVEVPLRFLPELSFLIVLQSLHDDTAGRCLSGVFNFHTEIAVRLREFAQAWGLEVPGDKTASV